MNTREIGDKFELRCLEWIKVALKEGELGLKAEWSEVFHQKGYHSKDRNSEIIFDLSIEMRRPGEEGLILLWLFECKDYQDTVPPGDVEEFFAKSEQISQANTKLVVISSAAFQDGARQYAKSKGIGVLRLFSSGESKWELTRMSALARSFGSSAEHALSESSFTPRFSTFFGEFGDLLTISPPEFFSEMLQDHLPRALCQPGQEELATARKRCVEFLSTDDIAAKANSVREWVKCPSLKIDLNTVCSMESARSGLRITRLVMGRNQSRNPVLGRIRFGNPPEITLYRETNARDGRERFTLAHELAHFYLDHGRYLREESASAADLDKLNTSDPGPDGIERIEWQANYFASCLLMPEMVFVDQFRHLCRRFDIHDHGFGELFLDEQECNKENYLRVTDRLMNAFGVSRQAARIRLETLGLLRIGAEPHRWRPLGF